MICHNFYYEKIGNNISCIQDEIPFEIPESWTWCRLVNLFEIGSSKRVHKSDWRCSGVPFYRARDIEDLSNGFFKSELYIDKKFYEDCKAKYGVPEINDILISAVGTLGKVFVVRDKSPFYYKDGNIICLSNFSNTNPDFIKMLFASSFIEKQIHGGSHGVTVDTYTIIRANQTIIPLPSRNEQDRIVKVWEKCLKELTAINNCKDEITKICGIAKTKILDSFFGENSSYKSYYPSCTIKDVCKLENREVSNKGLQPYLEAKVIRGTKTPEQRQSGIFIEKGTKVILVDGENSGEIMTAPFNGYMGSTFKIFSANLKLIDEDYLSYFILLKKQELRETKTGSAIPHLNKKLFNQYDILVPPLDKQKEMVKEITSVFDVLNKIA